MNQELKTIIEKIALYGVTDNYPTPISEDGLPNEPVVVLDDRGIADWTDDEKMQWSADVITREHGIFNVTVILDTGGHFSYAIDSRGAKRYTLSKLYPKTLPWEPKPTTNTERPPEAADAPR